MYRRMRSWSSAARDITESLPRAPVTGARATLWTAMTAEAVQALTKDTIRLHQASVVLASNAEGLIALSRELRLRHRTVWQEHVGHQAESYRNRLLCMISRKLRT